MIGVENLERKTSLRIRRDVKVKYSYIKLEPQASNGIVRQVGSNYRCMVGSGTIRVWKYFTIGRIGGYVAEILNLCNANVLVLV